jgi:hypothetical protein
MTENAELLEAPDGVVLEEVARRARALKFVLDDLMARLPAGTTMEVAERSRIQLHEVERACAFEGHTVNVHEGIG